MSRRGKYETNVAERLQTIRAWRRKGLTEQEIADNLGVGRSTLQQYKNEHPELVEALKTGKEDAVAQVESALFKRACGYEYEEVETTIKKDGTAIVRKSKKQVPPDTVSCIFFLKNRQSKDWCDRTSHELTGSFSIEHSRKELESKTNEELHRMLDNRVTGLHRLRDLIDVKTPDRN